MDNLWKTSPRMIAARLEGVAHFVSISKTDTPAEVLSDSLEEKILVWRPLNPQHAIERAKVSVVFSQGIPDMAMQTAMGMFDERRADVGFGAVSLIQGAMFSFQIGPAAAPEVHQPQGPVSGWQFLRASAPGQAQEVLELNGSQFSYETSEYGRWAFFTERLAKVWGNLPDFLGSIVSRQVTILEYVDRFIFHGEARDADVRQILGDVAGQIPEQAASGGRLWHVHRGWFEDMDGQDVLVNINLGTQDGNLQQSGQRLRSLEGYTRVELRHQAVNAGVRSLYQDLEGLHRIANSAFADALNPAGRDMIGIGGQT